MSFAKRVKDPWQNNQALFKWTLIIGGTDALKQGPRPFGRIKNRGGVVKDALTGGSCFHQDKNSRVKYHPLFKSWIIKLHRDQRISINDLAEAFNFSTKTPYQWILASRGGQKLSMKGWCRRHDRYYYWAKGKIKGASAYTIARLRSDRNRLMKWITFYNENKDKTASGYRFNADLILSCVEQGVDPF